MEKSCSKFENIPSLDPSGFLSGKSHQVCPKCGKPDFWVAPDGAFGKCYSSSCNHSEKTGNQTDGALWALFRQSHDALVAQAEKDETHYDKAKKSLTAWGFLKSRGVTADVVYKFMVGIVPSGGFTWDNARFDKKEEESEKNLISTCTKKAGHVIFWYTDLNGDISSCDIRSPEPNPKTGKKIFVSWKRRSAKGLFGLTIVPDDKKEPIGSSKGMLSFESTIGLLVIQSLALTEKGKRLPAIAIGSSCGFDTMAVKKLTAKIPNKFYWPDNDKPGKTASNTLAKAIPGLRVITCEDKDIEDFLIGQDAETRWTTFEDMFTNATCKASKAVTAFVELKGKSGKKPFSEEVKRITTSEKEAYLVTDAGVFMEERKQNPMNEADFFLSYSRLCPDAITVQTRLSDVFDSESYVKVTWGSGKSAIVPMQNLLRKYIDRLAKLGLRIINNDEQAGMVSYFSACLASIPDAEITPVASRNGWIDNGRFILGEQIFSADGTISRIERTASTHKTEVLDVGVEGDEKLWMEIVRVFQDDIHAMILFALSAVSPLMKWLVNSFTVHIWGDSSTGKTFYATIAASFWGCVNSLFKQWQSTETGRELYFQQMQNLPCFLDEVQNVKTEEEIIHTAYQFGNDVGKTRGCVSDGETQLNQSRTWNTILISTGERKITDSTNFAGAAKRVIEIERNVSLKQVSTTQASKAKAVIRDNYGHGGPKIIAYILKNREQLIARFWVLCDEVIKHFEKDNLTSVQEKQLECWAAVLLGCEILRDALGIYYTDEEKDLLFEQAKKSLASTGEKKLDENLYSFICSLFASNYSKFYKRSVESSDMGIEPDKTEIWGVYYETEGRAFFIPEILDRELRRAGYSKSMLSLLKESGKLITDKDGKPRQIKVSGQKIRMWGIKLE